jgi:hypothetical protein
MRRDLKTLARLPRVNKQVGALDELNAFDLLHRTALVALLTLGTVVVAAFGRFESTAAHSGPLHG